MTTQAAPFAWMLSPQGHAPAGKPSAAALEGAVGFATRSAWRVLPAIHDRLAGWLRDGGAGDGQLAELEAWRSSVALFGRVQNQHILRFVDALEARRIPYCLLKGAALKWFAYGQPWQRTGWDIDVAVPADAMEAALTLAFEQDYQPAEGYRDPPWFRPADPERFAAVPTEHHELGFLSRRFTVTDLTEPQRAAVRRQTGLGRTGWEPNDAGAATGYINLDLHFGLSQEMPVEPLIATSRTVEAAGRRLRVPSPAWALLHLVFKLYWEGVHNYGKGGYQYADLIRLAPRLTADDVREFRALAAEWRMEAGAYFTLRRLPGDFGVALPPPLLSLVDEVAVPLPGLAPSDQNDLGDMWGKLWGGR